MFGFNRANVSSPFLKTEKNASSFQTIYLDNPKAPILRIEAQTPKGQLPPVAGSIFLFKKTGDFFGGVSKKSIRHH